MMTADKFNPNLSQQNLTVERIYSDGRPDQSLRLAICDEAELAATIAPRARLPPTPEGDDDRDPNSILMSQMAFLIVKHVWIQ